MNIDWIEVGALAVSLCPDNSADIISIHGQGIRAIITLTENSLFERDSAITAELFARLDITYFHSPVVDFEPPMLEQAREVMRFIEQMKAAKRPVLMHCFAGVGRTGTMLHFYYLVQGMTLEQAKAKVNSVRITNRFSNLSGAEQAFLESVARNL